jgi:hypothetical protein
MSQLSQQALPAGAASPDLTPGVAYLAYNTGTDNFKRMLASAAIAASRTAGNRYRELRTAIKGILISPPCRRCSRRSLRPTDSWTRSPRQTCIRY